jgi:hypothetical protein
MKLFVITRFVYLALILLALGLVNWHVALLMIQLPLFTYVIYKLKKLK